ncbi:MAG TPA: hypothetical protein VFO85_01310, partial [Vicinamibacteria bacterium]|nr:hypothetical protein [Vicinamibacteria bacterium]
MRVLGQNGGLHLTESGRRHSLRVLAGRRLTALALSLAATAVLAGHTACWTGETDLAELGAYRRLWSDQGVAINRYLDARFGAAVPPRPGDPAMAYRPLLVERMQRGALRPWQFWRTVGARAFLRERVSSPPGPYDDPGRALLLAAGFRLRDGIAPFLIVWVGLLAALPVLAWAICELVGAGHARAAAVFALL